MKNSIRTNYLVKVILTIIGLLCFFCIIYSIKHKTPSVFYNCEATQDHNYIVFGRSCGDPTHGVLRLPIAFVSDCVSHENEPFNDPEPSSVTIKVNANDFSPYVGTSNNKTPELLLITILTHRCRDADELSKRDVMRDRRLNALVALTNDDGLPVYSSADALESGLIRYKALSERSRKEQPDLYIQRGNGNTLMFVTRCYRSDNSCVADDVPILPGYSVKYSFFKTTENDPATIYRGIQDFIRRIITY